MRKKVFVIVVVILTLILMSSILLNIFSFDIVEKATVIGEEVFPDGRYSVAITEKEPAIFFSPTTVAVTIHSSKLGDLREFTTNISNDGKSLDSSNFNIEWLDDSVKITLSGEEQRDSVFIVPMYNE